MKQDNLYKQIIDTYAENNSVKKTAVELGTSTIRVRRVLITEGLWSSPTSEKIIALYDQGLSSRQIAEKLNYTEKNVQAFLPYKRGLYDQEKSEDSVRSKDYRERKQLAAESQVGSSDSSQVIDKEEPLDLGKKAPQNKRPLALKLHLELESDNCTAHDLETLRRYGKMENAISRDIIVPSDITLHALHYAIQRLFGWQNFHLHHFGFPDDVFDSLTEGLLSKWCRLTGIYFRFPNDSDEATQDLFWDEDYQADMSIKSWLKSKYKGPYKYGGLGDYYFENQDYARQLKKQFPKFKVVEPLADYMKRRKEGTRQEVREVAFKDITLEEFVHTIDLGGPINQLLERLTIMDYLFLPNNNYFLDSLDDKLRFLEDGFSTSMKMWNTALRNIDTESGYEQFCLLASFSTVRMQAKSNYLDYYYDYGDGWHVTIALEDAFYLDDLDHHELKATIQRTLRNYTPICVQADGLPVLDDVGGLGGYVDFLETIHNPEDNPNAGDLRKWAKSIGWTGRMIASENIL